jgi:pilus assembly protein Flp/PilA
MDDPFVTNDDQVDAESGASLVEYALLLALIVVVCISAVAYFGGSLGDSFSSSGSSIVAASS